MCVFNNKYRVFYRFYMEKQKKREKNLAVSKKHSIFAPAIKKTNALLQ